MQQLSTANLPANSQSKNGSHSTESLKTQTSNKSQPSNKIPEKEIVDAIKSCFSGIEAKKSVDQFITSVMFLATALDERECTNEEIETVLFSTKELDSIKISLKQLFKIDYESALKKYNDRVFNDMAKTLGPSTGIMDVFTKKIVTDSNQYQPSSMVMTTNTNKTDKSTSTSGSHLDNNSNYENNTSQQTGLSSSIPVIKAPRVTFDNSKTSKQQAQQSSLSSSSSTNQPQRIDYEEFSIDRFLKSGELCLFPINPDIIKQEPILIKLILQIQIEMANTIIKNSQVCELSIKIDKNVADYDMWLKCCTIINTNRRYNCVLIKETKGQMNEYLKMTWIF